MEGDCNHLMPLDRDQGISIHSLRMEGDRYICEEYDRPVSISIHSLRMEGDTAAQLETPQIMDFNPLPPHGGRRHRTISAGQCCYFNPLPPHGGRLQILARNWEIQFISIHSLRMEGDGGDNAARG